MKEKLAISVREISKQDTNKLEIGRTIFMNYFMDLYKDISPQALQINSKTHDYLTSIFDTTEQALRETSLTACLAYIDGIPVGFTTFGQLESPEVVLIRTLPIALEYKKIEKDIRVAFMNYVRAKFPKTHELILMVRKANKLHEALCYEAGFVQSNGIFDRSEYVGATYDKACYNGYVFAFGNRLG